MFDCGADTWIVNNLDLDIFPKQQLIHVSVFILICDCKYISAIILTVLTRQLHKKPLKYDDEIEQYVDCRYGAVWEFGPKTSFFRIDFQSPDLKNTKKKRVINHLKE